jgi:hypothetical protein
MSWFDGDISQHPPPSQQNWRTTHFRLSIAVNAIHPYPEDMQCLGDDRPNKNGQKLASCKMDYRNTTDTTFLRIFSRKIRMAVQINFFDEAG